MEAVAVPVLLVQLLEGVIDRNPTLLTVKVNIKPRGYTYMPFKCPTKMKRIAKATFNSYHLLYRL
ncbi:hypothetical protein BRE01_36620 [Brevibacillus reuszeri]|uniref:Uncharacterized protein n=1 Tax=Brevibacillus reuszeri TaxID=54915 RepID=A0ABQ0TPT3_9BACL|nr:hypothetical protein BRE01_36620 [Brevibacillus reuszeri]